MCLSLIPHEQYQQLAGCQNLEMAVPYEVVDKSIAEELGVEISRLKI